MPDLLLSKLGSAGLNTDIAPSLLPPEVITTMYNTHGSNLGLRSARGERKLFDVTIAPRWHTIFRDVDENEWSIISDGLQVHAYSINGLGAGGGPGDISSILEVSWTGGTKQHVTFTVLGGVLVVNSSTDGPYYWEGAGNYLKKLPGPGDGNGAPADGWDWTNGWLCREMHAFRYHMFALNMTENGVQYNYKIRWSHFVEEGNIPTIWVPDADNEAGDDILGDTPGVIVGGALVRDKLFIVKEDCLYDEAYIGLPYVYQANRLEGTRGTARPRGITEVLGSIATFDGYDLILFDGQQENSLLEDRIRNNVFNVLGKKDFALDINQLFFHEPAQQLYMLISNGPDLLTDAYIFDVRENHWGHKRIAYSYGMDQAIVNVSDGYTYNEYGPGAADPPANLVYNDQNDGPYNTGLYQSVVPDIILYQSNDADTAWWVSALAQSTTNYDESFKACQARRIGLPIEGVPGLAMITEVRPELSGNIQLADNSSGYIEMRIGAQENLATQMTWSDWFRVYPDQAQYFDPRVTGRYVAWEIRSFVRGTWHLSSLNLRYQSAGER